MHELLTTAEMYEADRLAIESGISSIALMENAGRACADIIQERFEPQKTVVLCGPGNNGGDGFVIARLLKEAGWPVRLALYGKRDALKGDAAHMAAMWTGEIEPLNSGSADGSSLIIDAIFGAGLNREIDEQDLYSLATIINYELDVFGPVHRVCIDIPSGIDGNTGEERGNVINADLTITFFRKKPGHVLMPGRQKCGEVIVADIGIPQEVIWQLKPKTKENVPLGWLKFRLTRFPQSHKYDRGHLLVLTGDALSTGAARLAARAGLRAGAGLVTCAGPGDALPVLAHHLTAIMISPCADAQALTALLEDTRKNAVVIGPAHGVDDRTRLMVAAALQSPASVVLDADALTAFSDDPNHLFRLIKRRSTSEGIAPRQPLEGGTQRLIAMPKPAAVVLTPHEGEFQRLFPDLEGNRLTRARAAAERSGATIVLKGYDTIIADPDGQAAINTNAGPELATAGSGDVLAGIAGGLLAQGMSAFEAACGAVWLHGEAGARLGRGLIAEDLPGAIQPVLKSL